MHCKFFQLLCDYAVTLVFFGLIFIETYLVYGTLLGYPRDTAEENVPKLT